MRIFSLKTLYKDLARFIDPVIVEDDIPRSQALFSLKIAIASGMMWTLVFGLLLIPWFISNLWVLFGLAVFTLLSFAVNLMLIQRGKLTLAILLQLVTTDLIIIYTVSTLTGFSVEYGLMMLANTILVGLVLGYGWMYGVTLVHVALAVFLQNLTTSGAVTISAQPIPALVKLALFVFSTSFLLAVVYSQRRITTKSVLLYREKQQAISTLNNAQNANRFLANVVQSLDDMIAVTDARGRITLVNRALCHTLGYAEEELIGQLLAVHLDTEGGFCLHKDGSRIWVSASTAQLKDCKDQVTGTITIVRDQTALHDAESALEIANRRYELSIAAANAGVFEIKLFDHTAYVDNNLKKLIDMNANAIMNEVDWSRYIHADDIPVVMNAIQDLTFSDAPQVSAEIRVTAASGQTLWLMVRATAIIDEMSGERYILGTAVDVTEQRNIREALKHRDNILSAINYAAESYLTAADWRVVTPRVLARLGEVLEVSRAYVFENTHQPDGKILTSQRFEWTDGKAAPQIDNPDLQNVDYEANGFGDWTALMRRGEPIHTLASALPEPLKTFLDAQQVESIALMPIFVDTYWWGLLGFDVCDSPREWPHAEIELLETAARILGTAIQRSQIDKQKFQAAIERERMQILSNFITKAAHEFKTPLAIISTDAYLISRIPDAESDRRVTKTQQIQEQVKYIDRLIEAMVLMTRLDTEPLHTLRETSLNTLVELAMYPFLALAQSKGQTLTLYPAPEIPLVSCDEIKLERAITNLIENAVNFTPEGGTVRVSVRVTSAAQVLIEVADTGIGMDSDTRHRLFEHFYRNDQAHSTRGFGLGLPIARRIVELHGGSISVDSRLGRGSTFTVRLPLAQVSANPPSTVSV